MIDAERLKRRLGPLRPVLARARQKLHLLRLDDLERLAPEDAVRGAFLFLLQRRPDPDGFENYVRHLEEGTRTRRSMLAEIRGLDEFWSSFALAYGDPLLSLHRSRCLFVRAMPRARRILDLGGTHQQSRDGALVGLGYPYPFELLTVVDLPLEQRHELYREVGEPERVATELGPVEYHWRSMVDLSVFEDSSYDLVYSGQSIEHVTEAEADEVFAEVLRVLRPGGAFCLDTPNGAACRLQLSGTGLSVTNPDHAVEYTHEELAGKLERAGFRIREAKGLNHLPTTFATGVFDHEELAAGTGVFDAVEHCYLLAYVAEKPTA